MNAPHEGNAVEDLVKFQVIIAFFADGILGLFGKSAVKNGDVIEWNYTCNLGRDLGQDWMASDEWMKENE